MHKHHLSPFHLGTRCFRRQKLEKRHILTRLRLTLEAGKCFFPTSNTAPRENTRKNIRPRVSAPTGMPHRKRVPQQAAQDLDLATRNWRIRKVVSLKQQML